jgi:membrane-associated phospholipid phosphatase
MWPQRGKIDALDEALSLPMMRLQPGAVVEFLIAVPGTWFGMPPFAWIVMPLWVAWLECREEETTHELAPLVWLVGLCFPATLLSLVTFYRYLSAGNVAPIFHVATYLFLPCILLPSVFIRPVLGKHAVHVTSLVVSSWFFTQILNHAIKITARRMRPVVSMRSQLCDIKRQYPDLQRVLMIGETAFQSFPSGDAGGAMAYSYVLYCCGQGPWVWLLALASSFGRVFLHAHHVFDVSGGCLLSWLSSRFLVDRYGVESGMNSLHVLATSMAFVALFVFDRKYINSEVPAEFRNGKSLYGKKHTPKKG